MRTRMRGHLGDYGRYCHIAAIAVCAWLPRARSSHPRVAAKYCELRNPDTGSDQILLGDGGAEAVVVGDEFADELVQALLEDFLHAAVLDARADCARQPLRHALAAVRLGDLVEMAHEIAAAIGERARHLAWVAADTSVGGAVRTARALARAASKQLRIDDALALAKARNSVTVSSLASW